MLVLKIAKGTLPKAKASALIWLGRFAKDGGSPILSMDIAAAWFVS